MKKALRVIAISAGLISSAAALLLSCLYLEDLISIFDKFNPRYFYRLFKIGNRKTK